MKIIGVIILLAIALSGIIEGTKKRDILPISLGSGALLTLIGATIYNLIA
jgi:hypothetical protein